MNTDTAAVLLAGDAPARWAYDRWSERLPGHLLAVSSRFDEQWERDAANRADDAGLALLSIRIRGNEALIGPSQPPADSAAGCVGCAHTRDRGTDDGWVAPGLSTLIELYLGVLADVPLAAGELAVISADGTIRRRRVRRVHDCPVCADEPKRTTGFPSRIPTPVPLVPRPSSNRVPTRGTPPFGLDPTRMRRELVDDRYGPVTRARRKGRSPFAMTEVTMLGGQYPGYGRGRTFRAADAVAFLEAYERAANVPQGAEIVERTTRAELGSLALDPTRLGGYTEQQLAAPGCRMRRYSPDAELDWVWSHRLSDGAAALVPAEIGFYRYAYESGLPCFDESSSGSALGGSREEATLHSLIELAERDAFLLAWHRAAPLPEIDATTVASPESSMLIDVISDRGYDVHLLAATADIAIPVVWTLAVNRQGTFPAVFSAAGASPDPVEAVRSALWELGQLVAAGGALDETAARELTKDPWMIFQIEDHVRYNALPELADRSRQVLGGPTISLTEAFPAWPEVFIEHAHGDVTGALRYVSELYGEAGLDEILVVDQSSTDHRDAGLSAVKAVVPGITPMCFGHSHQRMLGLPRLARALRAGYGESLDEAGFPFDPHPFP